MVAVAEAVRSAAEVETPPDTVLVAAALAGSVAVWGDSLPLITQPAKST
ncbi:hypothetical protein [Pontibaca methylaminivorans]|uniref:Uncharacterized protein n=1 Tax=Pontibaca methylaminivorans TaxID=515897 RepID=A0A1R3W9R5_9RHOB|nr:hypothetical protein [Pontibaca methylaminivorans]SIT74783.1 hypothetical protein SAMN05421849_0212 [Pontibaca methylaminivorans]